MDIVSVTGFTAERMLDIENGTVVDGAVIDGRLVLTRRDGSTFDVGPVLDGWDLPKLSDIASMLGALSGVVNAEALLPWRTALANDAVAAKVFIWGDSITEGCAASTYLNTWPMQLQSLLRSMTARVGSIGYIPAASTENAFVPALPLTANVGYTMGGWGLGGRTAGLYNPEHHVTYAPQVCTKVRVWYGKANVLGGGLKVSIDGVDQGVTLSSFVPASSPNSDGYYWDSPELSSEPHTVKITAASTFVGFLNGVEFMSESRAPIVYNAAHYGYQTSSFLTGNMKMHWESVAALGADLGICLLGANDLWDGVTAAQFLAQLQANIDRVPANTPVLILGCFLRDDLPGDETQKKLVWEEMRAGMRALAVGRVAFLDLAPHWPDHDSEEWDELMSDSVHPKDAGMKRIAQAVAAAIGGTSDRSFSFTAVGGLVHTTLTTGFVPELGNTNRWTVPAPVTVELPMVPKGSSFLVLVDKIENISWGPGIVVRGTPPASGQAELNLINEGFGWTILIGSSPSSGGAGLPVYAPNHPLFSVGNGAGSSLAAFNDFFGTTLSDYPSPTSDHLFKYQNGSAGAGSVGSVFYSKLSGKFHWSSLEALMTNLSASSAFPVASNDQIQLPQMSTLPAMAGGLQSVVFAGLFSFMPPTDKKRSAMPRTVYPTAVNTVADLAPYADNTALPLGVSILVVALNKLATKTAAGVFRDAMGAQIYPVP